jgi:ribonucleoside-diphosphate reductase alpha chain
MTSTFALSEWTDQRRDIFLDRYALRDSNGRVIESQVEQMWKRVSSVIEENGSDFFYELLKDFRFVPGGRILSNMGSKSTIATYYNCFVIGVRADDPSFGNDSRVGILNTLSRMVELTSRGGGVGVNWSTLRPKGTRIRGVDGITDGVMPWIDGTDCMINAIRQGGSRTAALMFILDDWHPDFMEFICKGRYRRANYSVNLSDAFMRAVRKDELWYFIFPDTKHPDYDRLWDGNIHKWLSMGYPVHQKGSCPARKIWNSICTQAYLTGNPGLVFLERHNRHSNTWYLEDAIATNPCGEQILPANGSCNLGAINLVAAWDPDKKGIVYSKLQSIVEGAVRFLDRVIDISPKIYPEIHKKQIETRRIGIGTMGLADILILYKMRYGSPESLILIDEIYSWIRDIAYKASVELAKEKGRAPACDPAKFILGSFIKTLPQDIQEDILKYGVRNMSILTQAPTGTTSILAGVSSGIEPIWSSHYIRKDATGTHEVIHPLFPHSDGPIPDYLVTAKEVSISEHLLVQARVQRYLDASVSKTINLPKEATIEQISKAFDKAYQLGCKGITVFRDGSREGIMSDQSECPSGACSI